MKYFTITGERIGTILYLLFCLLDWTLRKVWRDLNHQRCLTGSALLVIKAGKYTVQRSQQNLGVNYTPCLSASKITSSWAQKHLKGGLYRKQFLECSWTSLCVWEVKMFFKYKCFINSGISKAHWLTYCHLNHLFLIFSSFLKYIQKNKQH